MLKLVSPYIVLFFEKKGGGGWGKFIMALSMFSVIIGCMCNKFYQSIGSV